MFDSCLVYAKVASLHGGIFSACSSSNGNVPFEVLDGKAEG